MTPEEVLAAVLGYTAAVVGCAPEQVTAVSRFPDGNRHAVYRVSHLDAQGTARDVVVRVSYGGDPADRVQAQHEASVLKVAGGHAAPTLHDFRGTSEWFDRPVMCMALVRGHQRALSSATPADITTLGSVVAWVHELPADGLFGKTTSIDSIESYAAGRLSSILAGLARVRDPLPPAIQRRLTDAAGRLEAGFDTWRAHESFTTAETLSLLHGDIGPGNVVWGTGPVLIDWEYTRLGDPADEIAYLFDQNGLSAAQRDAFWRGYRGHVRADAQLAHVVERATWWEPVTLLGSALWWVERWVRRTDADAAGAVDPAVPREPDHYLDQVLRRVDRLDQV